MAPKTALITGANGYIGDAVARAFVRAGWVAYGLVRSESAAASLAVEEILPVVGSIDDISSHTAIRDQLPKTLDAIVSTTEDWTDYMSHYNNTLRLIQVLSETSTTNGVKPLAIFSSGCKDYGVGPHFDGEPGLTPHTEESPLNPPNILKARTDGALKFLNQTKIYSPVVVRPTNVYGRSASYYRGFFEAAAGCAASKKPLLLPVAPNSICHALHVDDCGDAYVAIAGHSQREKVEGQIFNISSRRYETIDEIAKALVDEYGISAGLKYVDAKELAPADNPWPPALIDFPQWTGSEKLRQLTGWSDIRPLFSETLHVYRVAYEAASASGHKGVEKIKSRVEYFKSAMVN